MPEQRVRVAHVLPSTIVIGGTEHATIRIARAIQPAGFDSSMYCIEGDTPVRKLFSSQGFDVQSFVAVEPSLRRPGPYLRAARRLARRFRADRVDMVHCADVLSAHYTALAGRLAGVPVICHVRNRHALSRRDHLFLRPVNRWLFVSQDTWRHFSYRVSAGSGAVLYDGFDVPVVACADGAAVRRDLGLATDAPVVGMVARLSPQKDFITLVRAARRVLAQVPNAVFLMVGDFEQPGNREHYELVRREIDALDVGRSFVFTGYRSDVPRVIAAMDVFVLCTHFEGLPLVLLEGMAQGKPVVATNVDGIPELIRHGDTGLLHAHQDDGDLGACLLHVLRDKLFAARLGAAGQSAVQTAWTSERFAGDVLRAYRSVLDAGR